MTDTDGTVRVEREGAICTLTIDNPTKRNALSPSFLPTIPETLADLEREGETRVVVLTGAGTEAFSAGFDISALGERVDEGDGTESTADPDPAVFREAVEAVADFEYPTVAMVNGDAIGGGCELATACDLRVAVEGARFGVPPAKLGLVYDDRGIARFLDIIGPAHTKELLFTADLVDAERAREMGLLNRLVDRDDLEPVTDDLVERIAGNAPLALSGMKAITDALLENRTLDTEQREWARKLRVEAADSEDHRTALAAFAADETPEFEGR